MVGAKNTVHAPYCQKLKEVFLMRVTPRFVIFKNVFLAAGTLFLLVSSTFLGVSCAMFANASYFLKNGIMTEAVIEDIRGEDVWIRYSTDDGNFSGPLGYYDSSMRAGDFVLIYYDSENPGRIHAAGSGALSVIFLAVGLLLFICGGTMVGHECMRQRRMFWFLEHGTPVQADITRVEIDRKISSNYRHPYMLVCQRRMPDGSMKLFYSDHIWYDPTNALTSNSVTVFLDPSNDSRYYVDLSSVLPESDGENSGNDGIGADI